MPMWSENSPILPMGRASIPSKAIRAHQQIVMGTTMVEGVAPIRAIADLRCKDGSILPYRSTGTQFESVPAFLALPTCVHQELPDAAEV